MFHGDIRIAVEYSDTRFEGREIEQYHLEGLRQQWVRVLPSVLTSVLPSRQNVPCGNQEVCLSLV